MNFHKECLALTRGNAYLKEEIEDDAPKYKDIKSWYADLQKHIAEDPDKSKKQLEEKIKMLEDVRDKLKDEMENPSGWRRIKYTLKALIPFNGIYRLFKMNDNMSGISWLANAAFPVGGEMTMRAFTYKAMIADMLNNTIICLNYLKKKQKTMK